MLGIDITSKRSSELNKPLGVHSNENQGGKISTTDNTVCLEHFL
jgi:hypothetical protein